jgi:hypothetical protein
MGLANSGADQSSGKQGKVSPQNSNAVGYAGIVYLGPNFGGPSEPKLFTVPMFA